MNMTRCETRHYDATMSCMRPQSDDLTSLRSLSHITHIAERKQSCLIRYPIIAGTRELPEDYLLQSRVSLKFWFSRK